jgi:hypothetical protein
MDEGERARICVCVCVCVNVQDGVKYSYYGQVPLVAPNLLAWLLPLYTYPKISH